MSLSVHITGIKPPDEKWIAMKAVYDACKTANINVPQEVWKFFGEETPDPNGVVVPLSEYDGSDGAFHHSVAPLSETPFQTRGFLVDVTKLPPDVKWIKFENSW